MVTEASQKHRMSSKSTQLWRSITPSIMRVNSKSSLLKKLVIQSAVFEDVNGKVSGRKKYALKKVP